MPRCKGGRYNKELCAARSLVESVIISEMKYSYRPSYLEIESKGKLWAALYIIVDVSYYLGLLGGIIGCCYFLVAWPFDWLQQTFAHRAVLRHWSFYVYGFSATFLLGACFFGFAVIVGRWMFRRLKVQALD